MGPSVRQDLRRGLAPPRRVLLNPILHSTKNETNKAEPRSPKAAAQVGGWDAARRRYGEWHYLQYVLGCNWGGNLAWGPPQCTPSGVCQRRQVKVGGPAGHATAATAEEVASKVGAAGGGVRWRIEAGTKSGMEGVQRGR